MITKKLLISSTFSAFALIGCGGGGSSTATTGYFVDAAVANADYDCVADGNYSNVTGADGSFTCTNMTQVRFRVGNVVLGEINTLPADKYVFPQDLVGVPRDTGIYDARVTAMAQLLQSIDNDGNPSNGIAIAQETKTLLAETERAFAPEEVPLYLESASINPAYIQTQEQARLHLSETVQSLVATTAQDTAQDTAQTAQDTAQTAAQTAQDTAQTAAQTATAQDTVQDIPII